MSCSPTNASVLPSRASRARAGMWVAALALSAVACAVAPQAAPRPVAAPSPHGHALLAVTAGRTDSAAPQDDVDRKLAEVTQSHGGAGPWAVAGYRMGVFALQTLELPRGSFDLEIVHFTPHEVQYACIADGASAATGASIGKLNLTLEPAARPQTRTVYRRKNGGRSITLRVTDSFAARFLEVPRDRLAAAGREAMQLPDAEVFEAVKAPAPMLDGRN